jgi:hypothetical protein
MNQRDGQMRSPNFEEDGELTLSMHYAQVAAEEERLRRLAEAHAARSGGTNPTRRLEDELALLMPDVPPGFLAIRRAGPKEYLPMPLNLSAHLPEGICWRIALYPEDSKQPAMGLDIRGDTVLGRGGDPASMPDIDLTPLGAATLGVSRAHALLRPSRNRLYLIDLQSTNGTHCNGILLGSGTVHVLAHNDTISLGTLAFQVKIIEWPNMPRKELQMNDHPAPHPFA